MPTIDLDHMSGDEKLALIGEIWRSMTPEDIHLTPAQEAEILRRLATVDEDIKHGIDADALDAELDRLYP